MTLNECIESCTAAVVDYITQTAIISAEDLGLVVRTNLRCNLESALRDDVTRIQERLKEINEEQASLFTSPARKKVLAAESAELSTRKKSIVRSISRNDDRVENELLKDWIRRTYGDEALQRCFEVIPKRDSFK